MSVGLLSNFIFSPPLLQEVLQRIKTLYSLLHGLQVSIGEILTPAFVA